MCFSFVVTFDKNFLIFGGWCLSSLGVCQENLPTNSGHGFRRGETLQRESTVESLLNFLYFLFILYFEPRLIISYYNLTINVSSPSIYTDRGLKSSFVQVGVWLTSKCKNLREVIKGLNLRHFTKSYHDKWLPHLSFPPKRRRLD